MRIIDVRFKEPKKIIEETYLSFLHCDSEDKIYDVVKSSEKMLDERMKCAIKQIKHDTESYKRQLNDLAEEYIDSRRGCS